MVSTLPKTTQAGTKTSDPRMVALRAFEQDGTRNRGGSQ